MRKNRFQKGSGCFTCSCGKQTRDVGDNGSLRLCLLCQTKAESGNSLSDAGYVNGDPWAVFADCKTVRECEDLLTSLLEEGKNWAER